MFKLLKQYQHGGEFVMCLVHVDHLIDERLGHMFLCNYSNIQ